MNEQKQFDFLDMITIFTAIIQVADHVLLIEQASNDDILRELREDMDGLRSNMREIKNLILNQTIV